MTLILVGGGGHADDIAATIGRHAAYTHHTALPALYDGDQVILGINDPQVRAKAAHDLGWRDETWIHYTAYLGPGCSIDYGTHVNYMASMTRTKIGRHCTISPGVTICGDVTIGDRVFIGAGAVIRNLVTIGDDAFICMGASVTRDVTPGEKYR